jgi:hypothetical protein
MTDMQDKDLDGLLALAAWDRPTPSPALMDRVLADALAQQPKPAVVGLTPAPRPARPGVLARLSAAFGGGAVLAGVCSAAVAGVALGYLDPSSMDVLTGGLTGALTGAETLELFPSADFLTNEG